MEITYIGHSCFKIKGKDTTIVIDPYSPSVGYKLPKLSADIVLTTHEHEDHNNISAVSDARLIISGPGEYEAKDTFVYGIQVSHDQNQGEDRGTVTIYIIDIDGFTLMHLGDLGHTLSQESLAKAANVDVLMIPVGGKYTIDAQAAAKVISSIEPGFVIPMHYATPDLTGIEGLEPVSKFLDEMGADSSLKEEEKLKINSKLDVPEETQLVLLKPQH